MNNNSQQQWEGMFGPSARSDYSQGDKIRFWDYASHSIKEGVVQWVVAPNRNSPTTLWVCVNNDFPQPVLMGDIRP